MTPDDVLEELVEIRTLLDSLPANDPEREHLEARREELRGAA